MTRADWYWFIGDDDTQVYTSKRAAFVPADDAEFVAFQQRENGIAPRLASMDELKEVLRAANVPPYHSVSTYRIVRRIGAAGKSAEARVLLSQDPDLEMRFMTVGVVAADDAPAHMLIAQLGLDPADILAPEAT